MQQIIDKAWEERSMLSQNNEKKLILKPSIEKALEQLNNGKLRVCEKIDGNWVTHQHVKKAILLSFALFENKLVNFGPHNAYDKVPLKWANYSLTDFKAAGYRVVPGAIARYGAFINKDVVLMPSYINIGAYIDSGTLIDTWATVGSCAQIGKNCHISGGAGIGGVLEPIQANPVIIEDNVFVGARSEIVEGVTIGEGSVISMGVYIGQSTKIYDRETDQVIYGKVPPYSVVVPGTLPSSDGKSHTYAAIIVKKVDEQTRAKTAINDLLRESNV